MAGEGMTGGRGGAGELTGRGGEERGRQGRAWMTGGASGATRQNLTWDSEICHH